MEIEVTLRISNRSVCFRTPKYIKKMLYMKDEGWKPKNVSYGLFSTTYSFSKII